MRAYFVVPIAVMTVVVTPIDVVAVTKLTEQQVRNVCGKKLENVGDNSMGCTKKCGDKMCDYSCNKGEDGKWTSCMGFVVIKAPGGSKVKGVLSSGGILDSGPGFSARGPGAVGAPGPAPPPPAPPKTFR